MRISEYTVPCPTCKAAGIQSFLGFDTDLQICCTSTPPHQFDSIPGESPVISAESMDAAGDLRPPESNQIEPISEASESRPGAAAEERVRDIMESRRPAPDAAPSLADDPVRQALAEIEKAMDGVPEPAAVSKVTMIDGKPRVEADPETSSAIDRIAGSAPAAGAPVVGEGQFVVLPDGDILCGVRVSESWVGAMQAEGECKTPPQNAAQYLQEIIDMGLLSWYSSAPVTK